MTGLGPYRKGKKAFKLGRKNLAANRYQLLLNRIELRKRNAIKIMKLGITAAMGAMQIAMIQQTPIPKFSLGCNCPPNEVIINPCEHPNEKTFALLRATINTANQIQQILIQP